MYPHNSDFEHSELLRTINQRSNQHPTCLLSPPKIATFFSNAANMGLTLRTTGAFAAEGIVTPADLAEFDKEGMQSIFHNLRKPLKGLRAGVAGGRGKLREVIAYKLLAKSQIPLRIAAQAARLYEDTGQELNLVNMLWSVIECFDEQYSRL